MSAFLNRLSLFFESLPDKLRAQKMWVWLTVLGITVFLAFGMMDVKMDMSMGVYFQKDDPAKLAYDQFRNEFGGDQSIYIVYKPKDGDVFSRVSLTAVKELQEEIQNYRQSMEPGKTSMLDYITEVKSIVNVSYLEVKGDSLYSRNFIGKNIPETKDQQETLRKEALAHPDYPEMYISRDSKYGGILIKTSLNALTREEIDQLSSGKIDTEDSLDFAEEMEFDPDSFDQINPTVVLEDAKPPVYPEAEIGEFGAFMEELENIYLQKKYTDHLEFYPVGNPVFNAFIDKIMMPEMEIMFTGLFLIMFFILWFLFRSFSAVIWPLLIILFSTVWTIGLIGWSGQTMTMMVQLIVILNLVVGIADAVHILSGYIYYRKQNLDHKMALRAVFKKSALACMLTSITTAIGLFSLMFVPIPPIASFGFFAGIGVLLAFVLTVFWLPVALDLWGPYSLKMSQKKDSEGHHWMQRLIRYTEPMTYSRPKTITFVFAVLVVVFSYGMSQVKIDSNIVEIVKEGTSLKKAYLLVDKILGGTQNMEILVDTGKAEGIQDPAVMNAMEKLQNYMETRHQEFVIKSGSIVNVTKTAFKVINEDKESFHRIPQDQRVLSQTLFMFNNANPTDKRQLVSDNYQKARITLNLKNAGSSEYVDMFQDIQNQIQIIFDPLKKKYPDLDLSITGGLALMMEMIDYISWSQIQSFGLALLVISIILLVVMGSFRIGLIALVPNVFPIIVTFGTMGFLGISLDADTLIMAPIIIGIAVDDTIHFLTHYRDEVLKTGDIQRSIIETFREAGQAILFTSIILSLGFLVMMISSHQGMSNLGILTSLALACALLADFLLLPALCILTGADFDRIRRKQ